MTTDRLRPIKTLFLWLTILMLLPVGNGIATETTTVQGSVSGCVEIVGHPAYRGVAALWPVGRGKGPDPRLAIRPPIASAPIDATGCFNLSAAPGEYFVAAVVRLTEGGWQGPPRPGDRVFLSPDAAGGNVLVTVRPDEAVDIGRHATSWKYSGFTPTESKLAISGKLTGTDGRPLVGLLVLAFTDSTLTKEPFAISEPSDSSGRYLLRLPEPATVYLRARDRYGRRNPADSGYLGIYGGSAAIPVTVDAQGDKQDRNLTVFLIPPAAMRQKGVTETSPGQKNIDNISSKPVDK